MLTDRMELVIEYIDKLKEAKELETQLFGDSNALPVHLIQKPGRPKGGARVKIDRGKLFALKNAGWTNTEVASELGCGEKTVANILCDERAAAKEEGRAPKA